MPRRRLSATQVATGILSALTGLSPTASRLGLEIASHAHKQKLNTAVGKSHLVNYKEQGPRRKPSRKYRRKVHKGVPVNLSLGGGKLSTKSFFSKNKILSTSKAMPYRRRYKRRGRGRPRRRRLTKLPPLALPRSRLVRMRAVYTTGVTSTGTLGGATQLKANSLNDPGAGLTAILPLGLDQWASQYQKYIILGSKIIVRASPTSNTGPGVVGLHLADNTTALSSASHYKELPRTRQVILTTQKDYGVVSLNYSAKKFWKLTNIKDDSEQEGVFSTTPGDPTDIAYWHLYAQDLVGNSNFNVDCQIEMEFIVLLTDPVTLAESSL